MKYMKKKASKKLSERAEQNENVSDAINLFLLLYFFGKLLSKY